MIKAVLMSAENPHGHRLEDLLLTIRLELEGKNLKVMNDPRPVARRLLANNRRIVELIAEAEAVQRESIAALATLGPDQGPTGKPRLGRGSDGYPDDD